MGTDGGTAARLVDREARTGTVVVMSNPDSGERFVPVSVFVDRLVEDAASGMTVELVEPEAASPVVLVNGRQRPLPERTDGWEVAADLMYRCGLDVSAPGVRQSGSTFSDAGTLVSCVNRPFAGRLLVQLVRR